MFSNEIFSSDELCEELISCCLLINRHILNSVPNLACFNPSRWFNVCCSSEQTVSGLLRDWPRRPYHSVLSNILLCFHCLLCSCPMLSADHPQVVIADQPERNQHVAPQLCGYVPGIPATKCCGTSIEDTFRRLGEF